MTAMTVFVEIAERGSLTAAAGALEMSRAIPQLPAILPLGYASKRGEIIDRRKTKSRNLAVPAFA